MNIKTLSIITISILILSSIYVYANGAEEITGDAVYGTIEHGEHFGELLNTEPTKFIVEDEQFSIKEVWINVNSNTESSSFKLIKLSSKPTGTTLLDETAYHFYEIRTSNILKTNTRKSKFIFKVEKDWIENSSIDSDNVKLRVFKEIDWVALPTKKVSARGDYYTYESDVEEFLKHYVISGPKAEYYDAQETEEPVATTQPKVEKPGLSQSMKMGIIILVVLIGIIFFMSQFEVKKKQKR